jgi:hypothetical protein
MESGGHRDAATGATEHSQPRFGSYLGVFYIAAILGILSFAIFYDVGPGHAFDRLQPGMTPTEVAAILGSPRSETRSGTRIIQTWQSPDGFTYKVEFQEGKLAAKDKTKTSGQR